MPRAIAFHLAALALLAAGCGRDRVLLSPPSDPGDTLRARVEGLVLPEGAPATVTLSRGDSSIQATCQGGYYRFPSVDFGLYVLEARAPGYGGYRRELQVGARYVPVDRIRLLDLPWPMSSVAPEDSLVLRPGEASGVSIGFSAFMDRASVLGALRVEPAARFTADWSATQIGYYGPSFLLGDRLLITFDRESMVPGKAYRLSLDTSAATRDGAKLRRPWSIPVVRADTATAPSLAPSIAGGRDLLEPADTLSLAFPAPMDTRTVEARLALDPPQAFRLAWDRHAETLRLIPGTRWKADGWLRVSLAGGFRSEDGRVGDSAGAGLFIGRFAPARSDDGGETPIDGALDLEFNLPLDTSTLRYRVRPATPAQVRVLAPDRLRWTFPDAAPGTALALTIDTLLSAYGDTLSGFAIDMLQKSGPATFRFADGGPDSGAIGPYRDTLRLACEAADYQRLRAAEFALEPYHPFRATWSRAADGSGRLSVAFDQPLPAGTGFALFPAAGGSVGDTVAFTTRPLACAAFTPFYGEVSVPADEAPELTWNSPLDTVGFAAHIRFVPALDSVRVEQDGSGPWPRTRIAHAPFAAGSDYSLVVKGVADRFGKPMPDSLVLRFRAAP